MANQVAGVNDSDSQQSCQRCGRALTKDSPAMQLLDHVWRNEWHGAGRSWERLNSAMKEALALAIDHLFRFNEGDFAEFGDRFRFGRWGGADSGGFAEGFYSRACAVHDTFGRSHGPNRSACISFEKWKGREPFIYKDRSCISGVRLACGSRFYWMPDSKAGTLPLLVTATSFAADGLSLTACTYKDTEGYERKIDRRFKITLQALREQNAAVVKAAKGDKKAKADPQIVEAT